METPTYIVLSRQLGLRRHMDIVANNMANMNTPAYKAERLIFVEYLQKPSVFTVLSSVDLFSIVLSSAVSCPGEVTHSNAVDIAADPC